MKNQHFVFFPSIKQANPSLKIRWFASPEAPFENKISKFGSEESQVEPETDKKYRFCMSDSNGWVGPPGTFMNILVSAMNDQASGKLNSVFCISFINSIRYLLLESWNLRFFFHSFQVKMPESLLRNLNTCLKLAGSEWRSCSSEANYFRIFLVSTVYHVNLPGCNPWPDTHGPSWPSVFHDFLKAFNVKYHVTAFETAQPDPKKHFFLFFGKLDFFPFNKWSLWASILKIFFLGVGTPTNGPYWEEVSLAGQYPRRFPKTEPFAAYRGLFLTQESSSRSSGWWEGSSHVPPGWCFISDLF